MKVHEWNGTVRKRINRYIMECKCTILNQHSSAHMGINRYIMECKFHVVPSGFVCNSRINRYIMECKLLTGAVSITT